MSANKRSMPSLFRKFGFLLVLVTIAFGSVNCTAVGMGVGVGAVRQPQKTPSHITMPIARTDPSQLSYRATLEAWHPTLNEAQPIFDIWVPQQEGVGPAIATESAR